MRFESQFSRMNCQMFSTGFSSGHLDGSATRVMFGGTTRRCEEVPSGLVEEKHGVGSRRDHPCDLGKVQVHGLGAAVTEAALFVTEPPGMIQCRGGNSQDLVRRVG